MKNQVLLLLSVLCIISNPKLSHAQNVIFEAGFNNTFQSVEGANPANTSSIGFTTSIKDAGILAEDGGILQYDISNNIMASQGSITMWVKPNSKPGEVLRRILVVESSPVFEMHIDEGASLVFAMFSDQIETRIIAGNVGDWNIGDWHFLGFSWSGDKVEIYVDGIRIADGGIGFEIPAFGTGVFHVGALWGANAFDGILDELKIYDAPLTNTQMSEQYEMETNSIPEANAITITDIFGRNVTKTGVTLVDWEGPVRNPAMKYHIQGNDSLSFPIAIKLSTEVEQTSFSLPSTISSTGPSKTITLDSRDELESFLFSFYMDENFESENFDLTLNYNMNGLPVSQVIPVTVIDQDYDRPMSYPVIVDFSEAVHPLMVDPQTQAVITRAANDWLYYIDGEGIDEIPVGESFLTAGGTDHFFEEKTISNPVPYTGYYLFAYGNSNEGPCVCSTGSPNRELLQTRNGEVVPIFRIGGLHLNVFGQAFETEPTGWEVISPYDNWTQEGFIGTDMYSLAKHEIGHAMVFENSPLFLLAQGRDPNNPYPDESVTPVPNGFTSPALTAYYPDTVVPLFPESLSHIYKVLDPASQVPPYGGGVEVEVMPNGREMLTKLDILIMESVGYPLRENEVTRSLSISSEDAFTGDLEMDFEANLIANGGIPIYDFSISSGSLPAGLSLDRRTGKIMGTPEEEGEFPVTFQVKDYDERSPGATFNANITIGTILSSEANLISFTFDASLPIVKTEIDTTAQIIYFTAEAGTDVSNLTPIIEISEKATISPAADTPQNFTTPVTYTITSEDGTVSTIWTITIDVASSVHNNHQKLAIYPNPANDELVIEKTENSLYPVRLEMYTIQGRLIKSIRHLQEMIRIPLYDISEGLYLLRVIDQNGNNSTHKIMVEH